MGGAWSRKARARRGARRDRGAKKKPGAKAGLVQAGLRGGLGEAQHAIVNNGNLAAWQSDAVIVMLIWDAAENGDLRFELPVSVKLADHVGGHVVFSSIDALTLQHPYIASSAISRGRHTDWRAVSIMAPHRPAIEPART